MTTSELADAAGVNPQTVRYYERRGLMPAPARTDSGYRRFGHEDLQRLRFIKNAQEVGFSLREIDDLLSLRIDTHASRADARRRAESKIAEIDARIERLEQMRGVLDRLVQSCRHTSADSSCPILEALEDDPFAAA